ncbi:MAG: hypothetical protein M3O91_03840 [Chloroflexota bacterium]|nr:hypothetical protein [Chloroflexota bacterium]
MTRQEDEARRKAALWSLLAAVAQLALVAFGAQYFPYLRNFLIAVGYGFILPGIAVMHVRNSSVRDSGAILGTIAGASTVVVGLAGSVNVDLEPAALLVLGVWWWTVGKMAAQTSSLPAGFGIATAIAGALAVAAAPLAAFSSASIAVLPTSLAAVLDQPYFRLSHVAVGLWLLAIAGLREGGSPGGVTAAARTPHPPPPRHPRS